MTSLGSPRDIQTTQVVSAEESAELVIKPKVEAGISIN